MKLANLVSPNPEIWRWRNNRVFYGHALWAVLMIVFGIASGGCRALAPPSGGTAELVAEEAATLIPISTATSIPTPTAAIIQGTVVIWHGFEDKQLPALLRSIASFQEQYPNVQFDVQYIPQLDLLPSFEQAFAEGAPPSILIGPSAWGPGLFDRGEVADLSGQIPAEVLEKLNPAALENSRYRSTLIGLPLDIEGVVLYRNTSILPVAASTFDELVANTQAATQGNVAGAYLDRGFLYAGAHLLGLGGRFMDRDGQPAFNDIHGLDWLNLLLDFNRVGLTGYMTEEDSDLFKDGRVGIIAEGTWFLDELSAGVGRENLAIDPWPVTNNGGLAGFLRSENLFLTPQALDDEYQVAKLFALSLLSTVSQAEFANVGLIPAYKGSPLILSAGEISIDDLLISQAMIALTGAQPYPNSLQEPIYASQMDRLLKSVLLNGVDPAQALQEAQDGVQEMLESQQIGVTPTP